MNNASKLKSILLIAANPRGTINLRVQEEEREIKHRLRLGEYGKVPINSIGAANPRDIAQAMSDFKPQIVHFCGHGAGQDGLVFEDANGQEKLVTSDALADLFRLFSKNVECVVLNACYSKFQAEAIARHVDYVVGMNQNIGDKAAIEFATGFYIALGDGRSIEFSYELGCNLIQLASLPEHLTPVLFQKNKMSTFKQNETSHNEVIKYLEKYFVVKALTPEMKIDFTGSLRGGNFTSVEFNFQIGIDEEISIESCIFKKWIEIIKEQPVVLVLLCVNSSPDGTLYGFRLFHDWLFDHPDWKDRIKNESSIIFSSNEFTLISKTDDLFHPAMLEEAKRVLNEGKSLFRHTPLLALPITDIDIFSNFGNLSRLEVPNDLINELLLSKSTDLEVWDFLHEALVNRECLIGKSNQLPKVRSWLDQLPSLPFETSVKRERKAFRLFVHAMRQYKRGVKFDLPSFTYDQISCWRVFFQMFPESYNLLEAKLQSPGSFSDKKSYGQFTGLFHSK